VELLTEFNFEQAQQFASEIEQYNSDRKDLDKQITKEAFQIEENKEQERFTSVVFQENWQRGYWIVASRLIETYYRPTLVLKVVINMQPQLRQRI
jgi:single-stranded-DNA-specific exonuclease